MKRCIFGLFLCFVLLESMQNRPRGLDFQPTVRDVTWRLQFSQLSEQITLEEGHGNLNSVSRFSLLFKYQDTNEAN